MWIIRQLILILLIAVNTKSIPLQGWIYCELILYHFPIVIFGISRLTYIVLLIAIDLSHCVFFL